MKVLIVYGTYSGGTQMVAEKIASILNNSHTVKIQDVMTTEPTDFALHDIIILGSCTWLHDKKDGQLHVGFYTLIDKLKGMSFPGKPFAVYGLGDESYLRFCAAADHLSQLVHSLQAKELMKPMCLNHFFYHEEKNQELISEWTKKLMEAIK